MRPLWNSRAILRSIPLPLPILPPLCVFRFSLSFSLKWRWYWHYSGNALHPHTLNDTRNNRNAIRSVLQIQIHTHTHTPIFEYYCLRLRWTGGHNGICRLCTCEVHVESTIERKWFKSILVGIGHLPNDSGFILAYDTVWCVCVCVLGQVTAIRSTVAQTIPKHLQFKYVYSTFDSNSH